MYNSAIVKEGQPISQDALGISGESSIQRLPIHDRVRRAIQVEKFINRFKVENPDVQEVLFEFPTLCYLLGNVTDEPQGRDGRPDGIERPVYFLTEGSGMFALRHPDDAMRWRGIFNHILGSVRNIQYLVGRLNNLSPSQIEVFVDRGFDPSSFEEVNPQFLSDFQLISHAGRRQMDEYNCHDLRDIAHPSNNSHLNTVGLLQEFGADPALIDLMRVEDHEHHLMQAGSRGLIPNIVDNILTYGDWTFSQRPNTIPERFEGLRRSQRTTPEMLDVLEGCAINFEDAVKEIVDPQLKEHLKQLGQFEGEARIRQAYAASAGLQLSNVYPDFGS